MKHFIQKMTQIGFSLILFIGLLAGMLAIGPISSGLAHGTVDQYFNGPFTAGGSFPTSDIGQTFVPTVDNLVAVDVFGSPFTTNPYPQVRVSIHVGNPDGTELAAATITWGPYGWKHVDFGTPISLTPGNTYSIRLHAISGNPAYNAGTGYSNGTYWYCQSTCVSYDFDLGFRTYYQEENTAPTANAGAAYSGNEGSAIALSGASASDTDGDLLTYSWSVNSSNCSFDNASALNPNLTCIDNGSYTATLSVSDGVNPPVASSASVTVNNVAPTLGPISVDAELVSVGTPLAASASFTDPGTLDTHTAAWDWGDGTSAGTVTESGGSGSVNDSHTYSAAGVYTIKLTVTDKDGALSNQSIYQYVVVYDPSAGFVSGGGWIDSPAGAYTADPSLAGKATFGFVSRYQKGASVPTGNTQFQFQAGGFNFHSSSYDWLVVNQNGANAQFKGSGTVNGTLDPNGNPYKFMLWAADGSPDTLRIQIWWEDASGTHIVYDNGFNQAIGGGSIVVHN